MTSEQYVKAYLSQDAYLTINKYLIQQLGLVETTLLSLLLDRHTLFTKQENTEDGWFFCTNQYLQDTLRLGRSTVDTALSNLENKQLIKTQRRGLPAKKYFLVSFDTIKDIMGHDNQVCRNSANLNDEKQQVINNKDINLNNPPICISTPMVVDIQMSPKGECESVPPEIDLGECVETKGATIVSKEELEFDKFRKAYRGTKRGLKTEFENFKKKNGDWKEVLPLLLICYEKQCALKDEARTRGFFVPQEKNLQTYINQRCWEEEPQFTQPPSYKPIQQSFVDKMRETEKIYQVLRNAEQQRKRNV